MDKATKIRMTQNPIDNYFLLHDRVPTDNKVFNLRDNSEINTSNDKAYKLFFSESNKRNLIQAIMQNATSRIKYKCFIPTKEELNTKMKKIYLKYEGLDNDTDNHLNLLNHSTIEWFIPIVINNAIAQHKYMNDISKMPEFLSNPKNTTTRGENTLEFKSFF